MRNKFLLASAVLAAVFCTDAFAANYPGNTNFRNKEVTYVAKTRTDWVTNVTTMVGAARNPGVSTPINWSKAQSITNGIDYIPAVLTPEGGWPTKMVCHMVRVNLANRN